MLVEGMLGCNLPAVVLFIEAMTSDRSIEQDSEMMRLQILGDPRLMAQLQEVYFTCFPLIPLFLNPPYRHNRNWQQPRNQTQRVSQNS